MPSPEKFAHEKIECGKYSGYLGKFDGVICLDANCDAMVERTARRLYQEQKTANLCNRQGTVRLPTRGPLLVRSSLGDVLSFLDDGLLEPAIAIEEKSISLTDPIFGDYAKRAAGSGDNGVPPLRENEEEDPDGNGCNILFLHCGRLPEETLSKKTLQREIEE